MSASMMVETAVGGTAEPELLSIDRSDNALLAAVARGEHGAFAELYDRYSYLAVAVAVRIINDHGAAEDAVQTAFLSIWRRAGSFRSGSGSVRGWLLTIVRNAAVDRRRGRHGRAFRDSPLDEAAFWLATDDNETFDAVAALGEAERIRAALQTLPSGQRAAIELAYFRGLSHQEIAEWTGTPLGTVKGRMRLGLHKLRASLADLSPRDGSCDSAGRGATPSDRP